MFNIGDRVVHKTHGAGVVRSVETQNIDGVALEFVRVHLTLQDGDVLVPLKNGTTNDLRIALDEDGLQQIVSILEGNSDVVPPNEDGSYPPAADLIASGNPFQMAQAVRILTSEAKQEGVETEIKDTLSAARMRLAGELMLTKSITKAGALSLINRSIHGTKNFQKAAEKRRKKQSKKKD